jgi:hypothetical protein
MFVSMGKHSIRNVENNGELITLEDGSRLRVVLMDKSKSMKWEALDEVTVSSGFVGQYRMTHVARKETVEASPL